MLDYLAIMLAEALSSKIVSALKARQRQSARSDWGGHAPIRAREGAVVIHGKRARLRVIGMQRSPVRMGDPGHAYHPVESREVAAVTPARRSPERRCWDQSGLRHRLEHRLLRCIEGLRLLRSGWKEKK
eukprot:gene12753-biopygen12047